MTIPPEIKWPGMVIGILSMSVVANIVLVVAAQSGDGLQVEEDYYNHGTRWDQEQDLRRQAQRLGWAVSVEPAPPGLLRVQIQDRDGAPVLDLTGTLAFRHVALAAFERAALEPVPDAPGVYQAPGSLDRAGLWQFEVDLLHPDGHHLLQTRRAEVGP